MTNELNSLSDSRARSAGGSPTSSSNSIHVFGIRHHGPGSARSLIASLMKLQPDCILIEGPPEANDLLQHVLNEQMKPPVSLLIYAQENLRNAVYYPFAIFSPEWQAITYGMSNAIPVRFMDLPQSNWLALTSAKKLKTKQLATVETKQDNHPGNENGTNFDEKADVDEADSIKGVTSEKEADEPESTNGSNSCSLPNIRLDPLSFLAKAAGYDDSERWWENLVEHRRENLDVFAAISEAMTTLRNELTEEEMLPDEYENLREAHMRQTIRAAVKEGFKKLAVVCGAWHAPALKEMPPAKEDQALLKGLPKVKTESTWIPWTHARLAFASGYGAGVESPGWYHHLWTSEDLIVERWISFVARLLREEDLDASSAHVIEAVRLSETLASMRGQALPGLTEILESIQSVLCFGNAVPMQLIQEKLVIGNLMGEVPAELPGTPLQKDLERQQKSLRLPAQAGEKLFDLDLRNANDLSRSHLLHRLEVLNIKWGERQEVTGKSGTFHEMWRLRWMPEFALSLIEASVWGKTVAEAATAFACDQSDNAGELAELTKLLNKVLLADLPHAVDHVMHRVESEAAVAVDIKHLMAAVPSLVQIGRYGNVRKTDASSVSKIIDGLISRICIGLPSACSSIDEAASQEIFDLILKVHTAIALLQNSEHDAEWNETMLKLADGNNMSGLIAGRACRLLFDKRVFDSNEAARRFGLALSKASEPALAADWADGFLRGSGILLIHDSQLFEVVDQWVQELNEDTFTAILPLLRRTFSTFAPAERRQLGERVAKSQAGKLATRDKQESASIDKARGEKVLPTILSLLGLTPK